MRIGLDVLGALEHHVLEEVGEAGPPRSLVLRPDVIPHRHVDDRGRMILREDHAQTVRQRGYLILELRRTDGRLERSQRGGGDESRREKDSNAEAHTASDYVTVTCSSGGIRPTTT